MTSMYSTVAFCRQFSLREDPGTFISADKDLSMLQREGRVPPAATRVLHFYPYSGMLVTTDTALIICLWCLIWLRRKQMYSRRFPNRQLRSCLTTNPIYWTHLTKTHLPRVLSSYQSGLNQGMSPVMIPNCRSNWAPVIIACHLISATQRAHISIYGQLREPLTRNWTASHDRPLKEDLRWQYHTIITNISGKVL